MKLLKTGDPCPCCGQPIRSTNPEVLRLLTSMQYFGWNRRDAERIIALNQADQEAQNGTV